MKRKSISSSFSADLVAYLQGQGKTNREIGALIGTTESFVSHVANRRRSFTIDHLRRLEDKLGEPLSVLLFRAKMPRAIPGEAHALYAEAEQLLCRVAELIAELKASDGYLEDIAQM